MRISHAFMMAAAAVAFATPAAASDVRILNLPDKIQGAWAPNAEACTSESRDRLDIAARTIGMPDTACNIAWVTVTAARFGPVYSARSMCSQVRTGHQEAPSYLLITPLPDDTLLVRRATGYNPADPVTYRKC
jgi:hypothetical protein